MFKVGDRVRLRDLQVPPEQAKQNDVICEIVRVNDGESKPYRIKSTTKTPILEYSLTDIHNINVVESALIRISGFRIGPRKGFDGKDDTKSPFEVAYTHRSPNEHQTTVLAVNLEDLKQLQKEVNLFFLNSD